ncbi:solute carrier organic anion transporter family member [Elysia marginata]|uniref:Solute carrier organic anion transporter family member n=1 Tax=Elysia marginata TaxID=1093978 RepID=A0AAV4FPE0_9GAST|nr:solute carrier organic anion transporter family member [Elysia marginata]
MASDTKSTAVDLNLCEAMQDLSETRSPSSCTVPSVDSIQEEESLRQEMDKDLLDRDTQYGIGRWRPESLQKFSTLWAFVALYTPCAIFKVSITQYTRTQVSAIEDHFQINSTKAGFLITAVDIGSVAFALIGAHFGRFAHIPRLLAVSAVIAGLAVMGISVVQMAKPRSLPSDPSNLKFGTISTREEQKLLNELCWTQATAERFNLPFNISHDFHQLENFINLYRDQNYDTMSDSLPWTYFWTIGALIVAGAVMSYKLALQTYYVEHNVDDARHSGKYIGALQAAMVFGSPVALFLAAIIHSVPVDIESTNMRTSDPRWVSAWWLGYVIIGCFLVFLAIPVFPFPRRVALSKDTQDDSSSESDENELGNYGSTQNLKRLPSSRRQGLQGPLIEDPLLHNGPRNPRYHSNAHTQLEEQNTKPSYQYLSDDESFKTLYDKVGNDRRRYLSCRDLNGAEDLQLHLKDLKGILLQAVPDSDQKPCNQHDLCLPNTKAPYLNGSINSKPHVHADQLNGSARKKSDVSEQAAANQQHLIDSEIGLNQKFKSWPQSFKRLIKNPVIILMIMESTFFNVGLLGVMAFQLKYIEDQFDESASKINLFLGQC